MSEHQPKYEQSGLHYGVYAVQEANGILQWHYMNDGDLWRDFKKPVNSGANSFAKCAITEPGIYVAKQQNHGKGFTIEEIIRFAPYLPPAAAFAKSMNREMNEEMRERVSLRISSLQDPIYKAREVAIFRNQEAVDELRNEYQNLKMELAEKQEQVEKQGLFYEASYVMPLLTKAVSILKEAQGTRVRRLRNQV